MSRVAVREITSMDSSDFHTLRENAEGNNQDFFAFCDTTELERCTGTSDLFHDPLLEIVLDLDYS